MAKTFLAGEVLTADAVNNELNPSTAAHLARAVAGGAVTIPEQGYVDITFPVGRFSSPPIVMATIASGAGAYATAIARAVTVTKTGFRLISTAGVAVSWLAVQVP